MKDLDDILGGREDAPVAQEQPKDIGTEDAPQPVAEAYPDEAPVDATDGQTTVPVAALQAERQKAKSYKEQVAAFEQRLAEHDRAWEQRLNQVLSVVAQPRQPVAPPQPPDFWEAPETAIDYRLSQTVAPLQSQLMQMREDFSRMQAVDKHGTEAVDRAFNELASLRASNDPSFEVEYRRIMSSPHPYGSLVEWHKKRQAVAEIGDDPAAYKEKLKAELLAEMQGSPPRGLAPSNAMPSNFATSRNVGGRSGPAWSGPQTLSDIFKR